MVRRPILAHLATFWSFDCGPVNVGWVGVADAPEARYEELFTLLLSCGHDQLHGVVRGMRRDRYE